MLFFGTTINYLDRIVLGILLPDIRSELHISDQEYSFITAAFQTAYTVGFLFMGSVVDRIGSRLAYGIAALCWSASAGFARMSDDCGGGLSGRDASQLAPYRVSLRLQG